jgi:hypothetical protein
MLFEDKSPGRARCLSVRGIDQLALALQRQQHHLGCRVGIEHDMLADHVLP